MGPENLAKPEDRYNYFKEYPLQDRLRSKWFMCVGPFNFHNNFLKKVYKVCPEKAQSLII